jgi:protein required for attachment to host cells
MSRHWFVVADNNRTRIFTRDEAGGRLQTVETLDNPEAGAHAQDIEADRPGRSFDIVGGGRHSMGTEVDPVTQGLLRYVKTVTGYLGAACQDGRCNRLMLVAGPRLLGMLRQQLETPPGTEVLELEKNLGQFDSNELQSHLPERL